MATECSHSISTSILEGQSSHSISASGWKDRADTASALQYWKDRAATASALQYWKDRAATASVLQSWKDRAATASALQSWKDRQNGDRAHSNSTTNPLNDTWSPPPFFPLCNVTFDPVVTSSSPLSPPPKYLICLNSRHLSTV